LADARLNLLSSPGRQAVLRDLREQATDIAPEQWLNILQQACYLGKRAYRDGDPPIDLMAMTPPARPRWLVKPYLEYAGPTTLFGPGGTNKTYFGDALAVSLAVGRPIVGFPQETVRVLILDYESDDATHYERCMALQRGHNIPENLDGRIFYLALKVPLHAAVNGLRRFIADNKIGCVISDSLSLAVGGELESAAEILRCFGAARSLGVPFLFISHVTKAQVKGSEDGARRLSPFGSIYTENQSRNTWSIARDGEEGSDEGHIALVHEKTNWRYQKRHAYRVAFTNDPHDEDSVLAAEFVPVDMGSVAAFSERVPLTERVYRALTAGSKTMQELYEVAPEAPQNTVRATVNNLKKQGKIIPLQGNVYGLAYQGQAG
jgi:hypothetical protein